MKLLDLISSKIELFKLEQRYTRNRRSTYVSEAMYIDGEYIFTSSPSSPKASQHTGGSSTSSSSSSTPTSSPTTPYAAKPISGSKFHHKNSIVARREERMHRKRGNSLIEEVKAELERAEREEEEEIEDMVGRIEVLDRSERSDRTGDVGREKKLRNRLSRISISVREFKWDAGKL